MREERISTEQQSEKGISMDGIIAQIEEAAEDLEEAETIWPDTEQAYLSMLSQQKLLIAELTQMRQSLEQAETNPFFWDLGGGLKGFLRRCIRKATQCILHPITERQNEFNRQTVRTISEMIKGMESQNELLDNLNQRIRLQQEQLSGLLHVSAQAPDPGCSEEAEK